MADPLKEQVEKLVHALSKTVPLWDSELEYRVSTEKRISSLEVKVYVLMGVASTLAMVVLGIATRIIKIL